MRRRPIPLIDEGNQIGIGSLERPARHLSLLGSGPS